MLAEGGRKSKGVGECVEGEETESGRANAGVRTQKLRNMYFYSFIIIGLHKTSKHAHAYR